MNLINYKKYNEIINEKFEINNTQSILNKYYNDINKKKEISNKIMSVLSKMKLLADDMDSFQTMKGEIDNYVKEKNDIDLEITKSKEELKMAILNDGITFVNIDDLI